MTELQDIPKHSVHTLVFRSLKRTADMFLSDYSNSVEIDEKSKEFRKTLKAKAEYSQVLDLPKEAPTLRSTNKAQNSNENNQESSKHDDHLHHHQHHHHHHHHHQQSHLHTIEDENDDDNESEQMDTEPIRKPVKSTIFSRVAPNEPGTAGTASGSGQQLVLFNNQQYALTQKKTSLLMPKPQWHPPWKLYRVISGHLGWVRCIDVDPSNEWFVTGATDRIIKIWDLASGLLKLSLTGHVSTVRGVCISNRHPYLFSCGEDKQVKCWDLETNKVIRHYHGHLSACYALSLHPALDILVSAGRDNVARVWDMRTKAQIHSLEGHTNTVAAVKCQEIEPQIITGSHDSTIRCWDIVAGKTMCTLTNHKKSVRALTLHPKYYSMASASPDNIKEWKFPSCEFIQNLNGHNAILNALAVNSENVLVSAADNGSIHLWDWLTGYNFQRMQTAPQPGSIDSETGIFALAFDQSGSRLMSCEADKTIKIYKEDETATEESHPVNWKPDLLKKKRF